MKTLKELTQQDVIDLIYYDPITGKCYWRVRGVQWFDEGKTSAKHTCNKFNSRYAGKEIAYKLTTGYYQAWLLGKPILLHRLIWFRQTGEWPDTIDHINGIRTDNRWENLRNVTHTENDRNQKRPTNNTSGQVGVYRDVDKWRVRISSNEHKLISLGRFDSFEKAVEVRKAAEIKYGYHLNSGRD